MAKLFLSFLGTTDYTPCVYYQGEKPDPSQRDSVRFVQEATIGRYCRDWGDGDRIVIFTTNEAYQKNWLDGEKKKSTLGESAFSEGLKTRIAKLFLSPGISAQNVMIPNGSSEEEIWEIFKIVFECIHESDEVIFDVTHAFRSIPMLAIVVLSYAKVLKHISIGGIYYGAFEVSTLSNDDHKKEACRLAPILDLTPIGQLLDWTAAVDRFVSSGDPAMVSQLTRAGVRPILKQTRGADQTAQTLDRIADSLEHFCAVMSTCRGVKISAAAKRLKSQLTALERSDILPPFAPLFKNVKDKLDSFKGDPFADGLQAVKWCLERSLIQQGFTILDEVLICWILRETIGESLEVDSRKLPAAAAAILDKNLVDHPEKWEEHARDKEHQTRRIIFFLQGKQDLLRAMSKINQFRNDMNHAGCRRNPISENRFAPALNELLRVVESFVGFSYER